MTGYTVHTGSTDKFSSGWDQIFSAKKTAKKSETKAAEKAAPIKAAAKPAKKKK
ncbi:MAG: hypothetical protein JWM11_4343 [Planctomycetaceae bacterium]|nr:hypothetical protein [Planctomycetaceae bacterium]